MQPINQLDLPRIYGAAQNIKSRRLSDMLSQQGAQMGQQQLQQKQQQFDAQRANQVAEKLGEGLIWADTPEKALMFAEQFRNEYPENYAAAGGDQLIQKIQSNPNSWTQERERLMLQLGQAKQMIDAQPKQTAEIQNFEYGQENPEFTQQRLRRAEAVGGGLGKRGTESFEKIIGPMVKDSKIQASGAVSKFRDANRILGALEKGDVIVGPGSTLRLKGAQFANMLGFKGDGAITRTRALIRALTNTAVEARKRLAGQGQVTENEAKAVEKAEGGDIDDLTSEELFYLAQLNKKDAKFTAMQHQSNLEAMPENLNRAKPFFQVQGMDEVLQYDESEERGLPVEPEALGAQQPAIEARKEVNGKSYIKSGGQWYQQ